MIQKNFFHAMGQNFSHHHHHHHHNQHHHHHHHQHHHHLIRMESDQQKMNTRLSFCFSSEEGGE
jgi:hypothetical protein